MMQLKITISTEENLDDLTFASAIIDLCERNKEFLNPVKVANAILLEMVGEE
jgi:hypothetical protein